MAAWEPSRRFGLKAGVPTVRFAEAVFRERDARQREEGQRAVVKSPVAATGILAQGLQSFGIGREVFGQDHDPPLDGLLHFPGVPGNRGNWALVLFP